MTSPRFITHLRDVASGYDAILCDIWGVIHNGLRAFEPAFTAMSEFRARGGTVVLVTNAPRPSTSVRVQVAELGVPTHAFDAIVSSGDITRGSVLAHRGEPMFHLGPKRDLPIFAGLNATFTSLEDAHFIICTGLFDDETETPDNYRAMLEQACARGLEMVCANPDIVAERGDRLIYCAGSLAELYREIGGRVIFAGKPFAPIYEEALRLVQATRGAPVERARVLAIGDSVRTDLEGANGFGIDCVFVSAGIHAAEFGARDKPDPAEVARILRKSSRLPLAVTPQLVW